jgi:hypothetical protein
MVNRLYTLFFKPNGQQSRFSPPWRVDRLFAVSPALSHHGRMSEAGVLSNPFISHEEQI